MNISTNEKKKEWMVDKTPELTLFYNIAWDRLDRFKKNEKVSSLEEMTDSGFIKLKNYLWKDEENNKNPSSPIITEDEKNLIKKLESKLESIRNFQSHIYHSNKALVFEKDLKNFILKLYDNAISSLAEINGNADKIEEYHEKLSQLEKPYLKQFFENQNGESYITYEGKNFLLSLFLSKGDMKKFLKQRKGCKRDDTKDYKIKHEIYTFYCHSDRTIKYKFNQSEDFLKTTDLNLAKEIRNKRQLYRINTQLNDVPPEIFDVELFPLFDEDSNEILTLQHMISFCERKRFFTEIHFENNNIEEYNENSTIISHSDIQDIKIRISKTTLHKFILHQIKEDEINIEETVKSYAIERKQLIRLLNRLDIAQKLVMEKPKKLTNFLEQYENYKIRNNHDGIRQLIAKWRIKLDKNIEVKESTDLLKEKLSALPVELNYRNVFEGKQKKIREQNNFMTYAVTYFADHHYEFNIYWQWQAFDSNAREITRFFKHNPDNIDTGDDNLNKLDWRVKLTHDNQVLCAYEPENADKRFLRKPNTKFLIGHRTMRNLLIANVNDNKPLGESFFKRVKNDVEKLRQGEDENIKLLDKNSIPSTYKTDPKSYDLKANVLNRIENLKKILDNEFDNKNKLSRHEKNRQIMRCYRLLSWEEKHTNGNEKFLRKNEYNQLSKYHYLLEKRENPQFKTILETILNEISNRNHIPNEIKKLLENSYNIDDLFERIIGRTKFLLNEWDKELQDNSKRLKYIARKLGIPVYENKENNNQHVPFAIHPLLVIKALYSEDFESLKSGKKFSLSKQIWNKNNKTQQLIASNYNYLDYFDCFGGYEYFKTKYKKVSRKIIGTVNNRLTNDALLFLIGKKYDNHYAGVRHMHDERINLQKVRINKKDDPERDINIFAKYKQLQKFFAMNNPEKIEKIVKYMKKRGNLPSTTSDLPLTEVLKEKDRIYHESLIIIKVILDWEKKIINASNIPEGITNNVKKTYPHLNFIDVLNLASLNNNSGENLKKYRIKSFHSDIPEDWTYEDVKKDPIIGEKVRESSEEKRTHKEKYK